MAEEKTTERAVCRWAKKHGVWAWKMVVVGWSGLPDRLFIFPPPHRHLIFIEFKAQGKALRPQQKAMHTILQQRGFEVYTMDNKEDAIRVLSTYI